MPRKYKDFTTAEEFEAFVNDFEWSESEIGDISDYDDDSLDDPDFNIVTNNDANITDQLEDGVFENGNELDAEQVLRKDAEEFTKLLAEATRKRVKDALVRAKAELDREIVNLEMKEKQAAERKETGPKRFYVELNEYGWDQSEKFVKLFVTLEGIQNIDESDVVVNFTDNSMNLNVNNFNGKDYVLIVNNLLHPIDIPKSYRKIKTGMIIIYLKKKLEGQHWACLTSIEKRLKDQADSELKQCSENPSDALVNIMKKMYNQGDSKTKQMIAKAWTESQEKVHKGEYNPMEPSLS
ncbi:calcyclin-binding protein [Musca vetustissima]|uniref:calcyclin-binding protein n=1 Tax=Musca vetustissima TaxID=27455 RepID=UPI002AB610AD|nr:calcyclin-binding protein [Musca vetustissima]